jgi:uncharacterized membrane protein YeaQ/YmgE (transglycosylase-associated protein family)
MTLLPYFLTGLLGWVAGHVSSLLDRHSHWLRVLNYPVGILGAALGTMISQSLHGMQNKFLLAALAASACALVLFRCARRWLVREDFTAGAERGFSL